MEEILERRWVRLLTPSFSDLFFLAILVWVFAAGKFGWKGLLGDGDAGWHIRTGQWILAHHAVPHQDLYSFSKAGAPWYAWEWLSDVIYALLFQWAGLKGVVLMAAVVCAAFATILIRRMVAGRAHILIALLVALAGEGAASIHFLARPHIFTLLLISISMWIIESDRRNETRWIWALIPITLVWTNLHGGFLALIAVAGLTAAGSAAEGRWRDAVRYVAVTCGCAAVSLVNPYGIQLHRHVSEYLRSDWIRNWIQEFQSPTFRDESMLQFEGLMFIGLIAVGILFRRRQVVESLWVLFFAHEALSSVRHVPVFVAVCTPAIAANLSDWYRGWTAGAKKNSLPGILNQIAEDTARGFRRDSVWPVVAIAVLAFLNRPISWPYDFPEEIFPVKMVHDHAADILNARTLTTDQWADYLIFTNPNQKVFMDGRSDFYGPEIGDQYLHMTGGRWDWEQILDKFGFRSALLPVEMPLSQLLKTDPKWRIVEDDGKRILFVRKAEDRSQETQAGIDHKPAETQSDFRVPSGDLP
ncbi:MAG TPA: hypothetical protein VKX39_10280 [Bryobacteraceae bacterium]|jgi:hypothetical protein|nr:hypothetical protein [Bryobacteraceae bacterium]